MPVNWDVPTMENFAAGASEAGKHLAQMPRMVELDVAYPEDEEKVSADLN